jgi:hypothetical protein
MKISSPSLNIFYNLFLNIHFLLGILSIFRPYLAVFSRWIYTTPLWQNLLTFRSTIVFCLFYMRVVCVFNIFNLQLNCVFSCTYFYKSQVCEIWFKISMCICSVRIPSLEYSLFTWNLSIFRFNLAVLLPLWQNLLTFRSMIVFLFYRCVICVKHLNLQLNRAFSFT